MLQFAASQQYRFPPKADLRLSKSSVGDTFLSPSQTRFLSVEYVVCAQMNYWNSCTLSKTTDTYLLVDVKCTWHRLCSSLADGVCWTAKPQIPVIQFLELFLEVRQIRCRKGLRPRAESVVYAIIAQPSQLLIIVPAAG
jgi:hypothetical protein